MFLGIIFVEEIAVMFREMDRSFLLFVTKNFVGVFVSMVGMVGDEAGVVQKYVILLANLRATNYGIICEQ